MRIDGNTTLSEIVSTDELSHSWLTKGVQKEDHKYVKRVKKNGKWKYYYDWDELKKDTKNFVSDPTGARAKNNLENAKQMTQTVKNNIASRQSSDVHYREAAKGKGPEYVSKNERAAREKAVNAYRSDQVHLAATKAKEKKAQKAYNNTVAGKTENTIKAISDSAKGLIEGIKQGTKDILGQDEKNYYEYTKKIYEHEPAGNFITGVTFAEAYVKAKKEYMKTPMGMIEAAGESAKKAKDWLTDLFKRDEAPEPVLSPVGKENVIKENKIYEDKIYEDKIGEKKISEQSTADKAVKKAEEGLDLAKKRENYTKNQQAKLQSQLTDAKTAADKGKERWEKAKKDYEESSKVDYDLFKKALDQKDALNKMTDGPGKEAAQKAYDKVYNEWLDAYNESARLQNVRDREYNAYQQLKQAITQVEDRIEKEKTLPDSAAKNRRDAEYEQELAKTLKEYEEELEKLRKK